MLPVMDKMYSVYSIKTITSMESPHKDSKPDVCVCVRAMCVQPNLISRLAALIRPSAGDANYAKHVRIISEHWHWTGIIQEKLQSDRSLETFILTLVRGAA